MPEHWKLVKKEHKQRKGMGAGLKRLGGDPQYIEQMGTKQVLINGQLTTVRVFKAAADANLKTRGLA